MPNRMDQAPLMMLLPVAPQVCQPQAGPLAGMPLTSLPAGEANTERRGSPPELACEASAGRGAAIVTQQGRDRCSKYAHHPWSRKAAHEQAKEA
jgi:hypothetical protein